MLLMMDPPAWRFFFNFERCSEEFIVQYQNTVQTAEYNNPVFLHEIISFSLWQQQLCSPRFFFCEFPTACGKTVQALSCFIACLWSAATGVFTVYKFQCCLLMLFYSSSSSIRNVYLIIVVQHYLFHK